MKTMKFRLLATMITLAAVITATNPVNAQRRSTTNSANNEKVENARTGNKENIEKKSAFREVAAEPHAAHRSVKSSEEIKRYGSSAVSDKSNESARNLSRSFGNANHKPVRTISENKANQNSKNERVRSTGSGRYETNNRNSKSEKSMENSSEISRRSAGYSNDSKKVNNNERFVSNRAEETTRTGRYYLNTDDVRYKPARDYKGNNKYWTSDYRGENRGNNNSTINYNYNSYKHWDRNWENYRWNHNSWINYYGYYNPYSYRSHKYYYHHPYYGHVIRKFIYRPQIYVHNHVRYYCYDGYFFRYRSGIGYILVDVPFGMSFEYLPNDYERVYINGYLYFRIGNLFFERTNFGFMLVHYPERYYAYNEGYRCEGFNDFNF